MASDSEDYVEQEPVVGVAKKRVRTTKAPAKKAPVKKRGRKNDYSTSTEEHASPKDRAHPLPLPFPVSPATENVNRFIKFYNKYNFEDKGGYRYGVRPEAVHVQKRKNMPGRNYAFNVKALCKVQVVYPNTYEANNKNYPDGKITYWRMEAVDPDNENEALKALRLFEMPEHGTLTKDKTLPFPQVGAITTVISDDEVHVTELGHIACEILNKAPNQLDWLGGVGINKMPHFQRFVERTALSIWRRDLDFTLMPPVYITSDSANKRRSKTADFYAATSSTPPSSDTTNVSFTLTIQDPGIQELDSSATQLTISFTLSHISSDACNSQQSCPENSCYRIAYTGTKQNMKDSAIAAKINAVVRLTNKSLHEMQGFVGTSAQLVKLFRTAIAQYGVTSKMGVQGRGILVVDGVLDPSRVFGSTLAQDGVTITWLSRSVLEFFSMQRELEISDLNMFNKMFRTRSLHSIDTAYIKESLLNSLREGRKLLSAIFSVVVACDQVDLGVITHDEMHQCYCKSEEDRASTHHICGGPCGCMFLCIDMYQVEGGRRVFDAKCYALRDEPQGLYRGVYGMDTQIRQRLHRLKKKPDAGIDIEAVLSALMQSCPSGVSFADGYNGVVEDARARIATAAGPRIALDVLTVEKPLAAVFRNDSGTPS